MDTWKKTAYVRRLVHRMRRFLLAGVLIIGVVSGIASADVASADPPAPPPPRILNVGIIPSSFESTAVNEVLTSHNLPSSDSNAAVSWGRNDVAAQEFLDLKKIIQKPAASRTANEQAVYDWFQGVVKQQHIAAAQDAIRSTCAGPGSPTSTTRTRRSTSAPAR